MNPPSALNPPDERHRSMPPVVSPAKSSAVNHPPPRMAPRVAWRSIAGNAGRAVWLVVVAAGVPVMLWRTVRWPLPHRVSIGDVTNAWTMGDLDTGTVVKALACVVWLAWALVMTSIAVHLLARARRVVVQRPRLIPEVVFNATGRWLSGVTLAASTTVMSIGPHALATTRPLSTVTATLDAASATAPVTTQSAAAQFVASQPMSPNGGTGLGRSASSRTWTVADGETLWEIAEATLGDGSRWNDIFDANRAVLASTDLLPVGTELVIPTGPARPTPSTTPTRASVTAPVTVPGTNAAVVVPATNAVVAHTDRESSDVPILGTVTVERGDHFWKLSNIILTQAYGRVPTGHELDRYWRAMVDLNRSDVPSHNVNLIHPGEHYDVLLPELPDDVARDVRVLEWPDHREIRADP